MRTLILLPLLSLSAVGCLGPPPENACELHGMFIRSDNPVNCTSVDIQLRTAITALAHQTHAFVEGDEEPQFAHFPVPKTLHELRMYTIQIGEPYKRGWIHSLPYQVHCDLRTIWVEVPTSEAFTHEIGHVIDNCNGRRVEVDGYKDHYGRPVPKGGIDWHPTWAMDGRDAAQEEARTGGEVVSP